VAGSGDQVEPAHSASSVLVPIPLWSGGPDHAYQLPCGTGRRLSCCHRHLSGRTHATSGGLFLDLSLPVSYSMAPQYGSIGSDHTSRALECPHLEQFSLAEVVGSSDGPVSSLAVCFVESSGPDPPGAHVLCSYARHQPYIPDFPGRQPTSPTSLHIIRCWSQRTARCRAISFLLEGDNGQFG
jgi:hypothetical protein